MEICWHWFTGQQQSIKFKSQHHYYIAAAAILIVSVIIARVKSTVSSQRMAPT